jgi:hypothetical protein
MGVKIPYKYPPQEEQSSNGAEYLGAGMKFLDDLIEMQEPTTDEMLYDADDNTEFEIEENPETAGYPNEFDHKLLERNIAQQQVQAEFPVTEIGEQDSDYKFGDEEGMWEDEMWGEGSEIYEPTDPEEIRRDQMIEAEQQGDARAWLKAYHRVDILEPQEEVSPLESALNFMEVEDEPIDYVRTLDAQEEDETMLAKNKASRRLASITRIGGFDEAEQIDLKKSGGLKK